MKLFFTFVIFLSISFTGSTQPINGTFNITERDSLSGWDKEFVPEQWETPDQQVITGKQFKLKPKKYIKTDRFCNPQFKMPVAKYRGGSSRFPMPVAVPDSTVNYAIRIKKFNGVNPLEK